MARAHAVALLALALAQVGQALVSSHAGVASKPVGVDQCAAHMFAGRSKTVLQPALVPELRPPMCRLIAPLSLIHI